MGEISIGEIIYILDLFLNPDYKLEHYAGGNLAFSWVRERMSSGIGVNTVNDKQLKYMPSNCLISEDYRGNYHVTDKGEIIVLEQKLNYYKGRLEILKLRQL